jgi:uncharacterized protein (UPF0216 family)
VKFQSDKGLPPGGSNFIIKKYQRDIVTFNTSLPAKRRSLKEILETRDYFIRLKNGTRHRLDPIEIDDLSNKIPWYLYPKTMLPIIIEYVDQGGKKVFKVSGDKWDRRIVEVLLKGEFSVDGVNVLEYSEVSRLLSLYKSLLTIIISM